MYIRWKHLIHEHYVVNHQNRSIHVMICWRLPMSPATEAGEFYSPLPRHCVKNNFNFLNHQKCSNPSTTWSISVLGSVLAQSAHVPISWSQSWLSLGSVLAQSWFSLGSVLAQSWLSLDSVLAQSWLSLDSGLAQSWLSFGSVLAQYWLSLGSVLAQSAHVPASWWSTTSLQRISAITVMLVILVMISSVSLLSHHMSYSPRSRQVQTVDDGNMKSSNT